MEFLFLFLLFYAIFRISQPSEKEAFEAKKREIDREIELEKYRKSSDLTQAYKNTKVQFI